MNQPVTLRLAYLIAPHMQMMHLRNVLHHCIAITAFIFGTRLF